MRSIATITMVLTLGACAPLYPVQIAQTGPHTYVATQESASSWLDARTAAIQRAAKFCEKSGRVIQVTSQSQQRSADWLTANDHASVDFECVVPSAQTTAH
jgi:hypothetical protein